MNLQIYSPLFTIPMDQQFVFVQTISAISSYQRSCNELQKMLPHLQDLSSIFLNANITSTLYQHSYVSQHDSSNNDDDKGQEKTFDQETGDIKNFINYHINQVKAGNVCEGQLEFLGSKRSHHHATAVKV